MFFDNLGPITMTDFLVVCSFGYGSGSWARDADLEKAVRRCKRIAYSDWGHLFNLDGAKVTLSLFDVEGQDAISISDVVEGDNPDVPIKNLGTREITFPRKRR